MYFRFYKFITYLFQTKSRVVHNSVNYSAVMVLQETNFTEIKITVSQCNEKERQLKLGQKYQQHMLSTKSMLQEPSHLHE